ncbi:MAG: MEDS domain-containing protein [Micromonosporaceae bacterium]
MPTAAGDVAVAPQSHVVQFYGCDEELAGSVGGYIADAIADGGVAIVAATPVHQRAFETWLAEAGVDVAAARAGGALVALDAGDVVRRLLAGERIDPVGFDSVIGQAIRQVAQTGRPVRVFGEMVTVLWDAGQVNAALELEILGNRLLDTLRHDVGQDVPVSLLCAYPRRLAGCDEHVAAVRQVCHLHTAVAGAAPAVPAPPGQPGDRARATRTFPCVPDAPREARGFVSETLRQWDAVTLVPIAEFVVSELATNAIVHAESGFTVEVSSVGDVLRICVRDSVPLAGGDEHAPLPAKPGYSLGVIAALASQWRAEPAAGGKAVWAELRH